MSQPSRMVFKVTVLGDGGVGKTALTVQFTMSSFVETYDPTIEDCYRKQWVVDDQPCLLEVLDTAGQEEYTALRDQWIRDGEGFLVVYSIAARSTFDRVEKIVERIMLVKEEAWYAEGHDSPPPGRPHSGGKPGSGGSGPGGDGHHHRRVPVVIVGNKRDQTNSREVSTEEGRMLAQRLGCEFFETSARLNQNVEDSFRALVKLIQRDKRPEPTAQAASTPRKKHRKCRIL